MDVHPIVRQVVNRCHVGESYLSVIKYVMTRLAEDRATYWAMRKEDRKGFLRMIIHVHAENRELYQSVMRGGQW